jgi:hypothetical protein
MSFWADFKSTSCEVGGWIWGAAEGGFNEQQTIGQILTDAVISMFPIAGEVTAARDAIASAIRLAEFPEKRKEVIEWIMFILPLLALVPLMGGALKGIGKLLLRAGKNIDEDKKILEACIWLLNKVGEGDAVKFIKELDFEKYKQPVIDGVKEVCKRINDALEYFQKKMGAVLPDSVKQRMQALQYQIKAVQELVDKMVPQALKDLNNKLKYIQKLAYQGEWHLIPGAGKQITRETEARLVTEASGAKHWEVTDLPHPPSNYKIDFEEVTGWPDLTTDVRFCDPSKKNFWIIEAFSGEIEHVEIPAGETIYRVLEAGPRSEAQGVWWALALAKDGPSWRKDYAVLQKWSKNGKYVKYTLKKPLHVWKGKVASQIDNAREVKNYSTGGMDANKGFGQYLEGGEKQIFIDFTHPANEHALKDIKALNAAKIDTHWTGLSGINILEPSATAEKLGTHVVEQKTLPAANLSSAANASGKLSRAAANDDSSSQTSSNH